VTDRKPTQTETPASTADSEITYSDDNKTMFINGIPHALSEFGQESARLSKLADDLRSNPVRASYIPMTDFIEVCYEASQDIWEKLIGLITPEAFDLLNSYDGIQHFLHEARNNPQTLRISEITMANEAIEAIWSKPPAPEKLDLYKPCWTRQPKGRAVR
jgi:hypothetical protein